MFKAIVWYFKFRYFQLIKLILKEAKKS